MDDSDSSHDDWIRQWIAQQRSSLHQSGASQAGAEELRGQVQQLGEKWLDLGQAYLTGLQQFAAGTGISANPAFKLGEDFIGAWRTQWSQSAPKRDSSDAASAWSDVLRQLPPIGFAREHHAMLRELATTQAECQCLEQALRSMIVGVQTEALNLLERRVRERTGTAAVRSFRELYDLWIECGEQVYAQVAHSEAYCQLQAQLGNAAIRLRARQQKLLEHVLKQLDLPTRSELNSVHRQLRQQAQRLRELEQQLQAQCARSQGSSA